MSVTMTGALRDSLRCEEESASSIIVAEIPKQNHFSRLVIVWKHLQAAVFQRRCSCSNVSSFKTENIPGNHVYISYMHVTSKEKTTHLNRNKEMEAVIRYS